MRIVYLLPAILFLFLIESCTIWNAKDWERLQDRRFSFQQFTYYEKGSEQEHACAFIKRFPVATILKGLAHRYALTIDYSEFENFTSSGDCSQIAVFGILSNEEFVWKSVNPQQNTVELEYRIVLDEDLSFSGIQYKLLLKTDNATRALYIDFVSDERAVLRSIFAKLGFAPDDCDLAQKDTLRLHSEPYDDPGERARAERRIRESIDRHMRRLAPEQRKKFREALIDHLKKDEQ
jgi:hypothetical protein